MGNVGIALPKKFLLLGQRRVKVDYSLINRLELNRRIQLQRR